MSIEVLDSGLLTTVQDLGRHGHQRYGVPVSGAMDPLALRAANILVGNSPSEAALEITVVGPRLRMGCDCLVAITGGDLRPTLHSADFPRWELPLWTAIFLRRGSLLSFQGRRNGCRAYLAVISDHDLI